MKIPPEVRTAIESVLRTRNSRGITESEADFVSGAIAALVAIHGPEVEIPPMWALGPMTGRPILPDCPGPHVRPRAQEED